jgi:hypothetical protein
MENLTPTKIESMIYLIRGHKVMLDSDLAELYKVTTGRLNEQVKRNIDRFPSDFMFQISEKEFEELHSLIGNEGEKWGGRRKLPVVFTECGVAMLSSVLSSSRAIQVNISIMRTFIKMRSFLAMESGLAERVGRLESGTNQLFKAVFERLDSYEDTFPAHPKDRKRIGIHNKKN